MKLKVKPYLAAKDWKEDYDLVSFFVENFAVVRQRGTEEGYNYKYGIVDGDGKIILPCKYFYIQREEGFSDKTGPLISSGLFIVGQPPDETKLNRLFYGAFNKEGKQVIPFEFLNIRPFSEGLAAASPKSGQKPNHSYGIGRENYGYIDTEGNLKIPSKYQSAGDFKNGIAIVGNEIGNANWRFGLINKEGVEIAPLINDSITRVGSGFKARRKGTKFSIDSKGNENLPSALKGKLFKQMYKNIYSIETDPSLKSHKSLVNIENNKVLFDDYFNIETLREQKPVFRSTLVQIAKKDEKDGGDVFGVFDLNKEQLIVPVKYKGVGKLNERFYSCVSVDKKNIVFDVLKKEEITIPNVKIYISPYQEYSQIRYFLESPNGWSTVDDNGHPMFFDKDFKSIKLWTKDYDEVRFISYREFYTEERIHTWWKGAGHKCFYVVKNDKCGLYVTDLYDNGHQVTDLIFDKQFYSNRLWMIKRIPLKGFDNVIYFYDLLKGKFYTTENGSITVELKQQHYSNLNIIMLENRYGIEEKDTKKIILPAVYNFIQLSTRPNKQFEVYINGTVGEKNGIKNILSIEETYEKGEIIKKALKDSPVDFLYLFNHLKSENETFTPSAKKKIEEWFKLNTS